MELEEVFGRPAGNVWRILKEKGAMSASALYRQTELKKREIFGALGWLGREGKIKVMEGKRGTLYDVRE